LHDAVHDIHHAIGVHIARLDSDQYPPAAQGIDIPLRLIRRDAGILQDVQQATSRRVAGRV
jgi:hypothetical protein